MESERHTLTALVDTLLPPINQSGSNDAATEFFQKSGTELYPEIVDDVIDTMNKRLGDKASTLFSVLKIMDNGWGMTALSTGTFTKPFADLSLDEREKFIQSLSSSPIATKRLVAKIFKALILATFYSKSIDGKSVFSEMVDYPVKSQFPLTNSPYTLPVITLDQLQQDSFDVIVVGSGCGGGNVAQQTSLGGLSTLVLDKGPYVSPEKLGWSEKEGVDTFYEKAGLLGSEDASISILASSSVGGGSNINWSACLRLQHYVKDEWFKYGLDFVHSDQFTKSMDYICDRMGVNVDKIKHSKMNQNLIDGTKLLGMHCADVPQNTGNMPHNCSHCHMGCPDQVKQSTPLTFLRDAVEHGAIIVQNAHVGKVLIENGRAVGVEVVTGTNSVRKIKAKKAVVVSGGSLWTPVILQNSGLKNPNIGSNLRLHPATVVAGFFENRQEPWNGPILSTVCNSFEKVGNGGVKIETPTVHPGLFAGVMAWRSGKQHKFASSKFANLSSTVVISRDTDSVGKVTSTKLPNGEYYPKIDFTLGKNENLALTEGTIASAKILLAAGAQEIDTTLVGVKPFKRSKNDDSLAFLTDPKFEEWCRQVRAHGYKLYSSSVATAHQMGSCRMGKNSSLGACKPTGETWEVKDLYVADTSLFPTASGVNPMVTCMALSHIVGANISQSH